MTELRCVDCMHRPHVGRCGKEITTLSRDASFCPCLAEINRDLSGSDIHQKSEGCWCGAHIDVEGSEQDVVGACTNFRNGHRHKQPSKEDQIQAVLDALFLEEVGLMSHHDRVQLRHRIYGVATALGILRGTDEVAAARKRMGVHFHE